MKNQYAIDSLNEIVNISNVNKQEKREFFCCNCGDKMIPKKGEINAHHFAHKTSFCSYESYLHKLAKLKFFITYSKCLHENKPFFLEYFIDQECVSCEKDFNIKCNFRNSTKLFDLTKKFDKIEIEKGINGFVADVLLSSSLSDENILIEFAVKHFCSYEKKSSGLRIIEIPIENDNYIKLLDNNSFKFQINKQNLYNFKKRFESKNIFNPYQCKNLFFLFTVGNDGKAYSYSGQMREILGDLSMNEYKYYEIIKDVDYESETSYYIESVKEASLKGIKVMNCHACKFMKPNTKRFKDSAWFCTKHKAEISNSNYACEKLWRID